MILRNPSGHLSPVVVFLALFCSSAWGHERAHDPWLLSFGNISTDSAHAYFEGEAWVGLYVASQRMMFMAPQDSITVPAPVSLSDSVVIGSTVYTAKGSTLIKQKSGRKPRVFKLPKSKTGSRSTVRTIHGLNSSGERVWFGLELEDTTTHARSAGLGWFDMKRSRMGQAFDSSLGGCAPAWIGVAADTVNILCESTTATASSPRLMRYAVDTGTWSAFDLARLNLPDESVRSAAVWGDTLLLTTDTNIIIWRPRERAEMWGTWMYAAPEPAPLYMVNFSPDSNASGPDTLRFRTLRAGEPVEVRAWYGEYAEIIPSDEVQAYVDDADWRAHQKLWSEHHWDCGDSLCFARLRILRGGRLSEVHVIHVPISYVGKDDNGLRVSFQAAWVRQEDLLPVLLPR